MAMTAGILLRYLSNQSCFKIPPAKGESDGEDGSSLGLKAMISKILERLGNARVLIGGC